MINEFVRAGFYAELEKTAFLGAIAKGLGSAAASLGGAVLKSPKKTLGMLGSVGLPAAFNTYDVASKSLNTAKSIATSNNRLKGAIDAAQVFRS
jgi:hypothetical protein